MTPQLYIKLSSQIARQTPELADYETQVIAANIRHLNAQPAVDAAQTVRDAAQAELDAVQALGAAAHAAMTQARADDTAAITASERAPAGSAEWDAAQSAHAEAFARLVAAAAEVERLAPLIETAQAALAEADTALQAAKAAQAVHTSERDALQKQADAIAASIAQCQADMDASGLALSQAEMDAIRNAPVVPKAVTRRQAKTVMELTPHPIHGDLWKAALATANAIPDAQTRIVTVNYLLESLNFEYPQVLSMAQGLLGMTSTQVDALFIAAAQL